MNICTIVAKNYLAHARVLARSFAEHHPDGHPVVLVVDAVAGELDEAGEPFDVVTPADLPLDAAEFDEMRGIYDVLELSTALKPWMLELMLDRFGDGSGVCYFDPDIEIFSRIVEVDAALGRGQVVLTPHLTAPLPRDGRIPSEPEIIRAGSYNLGFIGVPAGDQGRFLLRWWQERLRTDCRVDFAAGLFVDQRWIDLVPGLLDDVAILRHPSLNVAYWNLPARSLSRTADGYAVDGLPLRFFHFSGFDPREPDRLSKYQDRLELRADEVLGELCDRYGAALEAAGLEVARGTTYGFDRLPNGLTLDSIARTLYREARERGELPQSIFTEPGAQALTRWLIETDPQFGPAPLSRYLWTFWRSRDDVRRQFPDPTGADHINFSEWCRAFGDTQAAIPSMLRPPAAGGSSTTPPAPAGPSPEAPDDSDDDPDPALYLVPALGDDGSTPVQGVNVVGYLRSELSTGEVARQITRALDAAGVPSLPTNLVAGVSRQGHRYVAPERDDNPFPVNLVVVNADAFPGFAAEAGPEFFAGRYTIGYWWWELEEFPERWQSSFEHVDEIWTGSAFVAEALARVSPVPVVHVPVPIDVVAPPALDAGERGWPDAFTFLFVWDYNGTFDRKNPLGTVAAYTAAFGPEDGTALVLKCINHARSPEEHARLRRAIAGRPDIVLIDEVWSSYEKDRLLASTDCYVSLHRSEGFGLTIGEAMFLGKPVVATNYSGNLELMTERNSFLVDCRRVAVGPNSAPYSADAVWAAPDIDHAAQQLRRVFEDRDEAASRAARAAADIRARHAPTVAGHHLRARLAEIERDNDLVAGRTRYVHPSLQAAAGDEQLGRLIELQGLPRAPSRFGRVGAAMRRGVLRVMKPYTSYQADVNAELQASVGRLRDDVDRAIRAVESREARHYAVALAELRHHAEALERQRARAAELLGGAGGERPPAG